MSEKKYGAVVKMATLSIIILEYSISLSTPTLGAIAAAFPNVSDVLIKQVQSLPNLTMIIVALMVGQLEKIMSKRTMLMIAIALMFVGGIMPAMFGGIYFILFCRAIFGMGRGVVFPFAMSFIVDLFDGQERNVMMGLRSSTGSIAGIIFMQVGGYLATINWRYSFWGFLIMLPFALLIYFKLPEPEKKPVPKATGSKKARLSGSSWVLILGNSIMMFFAYSFITNMAIVIMGLGIGTPATVGNVMTAFVVTSAFCGLLYGKFVKPLFKRYTLVVGMFFIGAGITFLITQETLSMFYIGSILFGIGFSVYNTDQFLNVPASANDPSAAAMSLSMFMAFNGLGQFGSPIVLSFMSNMFGFEGVKAGWAVSGPAVLIMTAITLILVVTKRIGAASNDTTVAPEAESKIS